MTQALHERFGFDTIFSNDGDVTSASPRPKRLYTADEAEALGREAFAHGERQALDSMQALQAQALAEISQACGQALTRLAEVAHEHRIASAELALACARAIADAALDAFPHAPLQAAFESLAREIESAPRLLVSAAPEMAEGLTAILSEAAQAIGFSGQILVRPTPVLAKAAFTLDFGDGSATFDPDQASARVAAALTSALAAEGIHAEPLIPGNEG